jgi:predicted nucleic acid-binding protein
MKVIVSDTSVIIDLCKVQLIEPAFSLPYEFVVPDVMFADEFLDLGDYERDDLLASGLSVSVLSGEAVALAVEYGATFRKSLSTNDQFALALAKSTEYSILLTGDKRLRNAAASKEVEVRGLLWICDQMEKHRAVGAKRLGEALVALDEDELVRVPRAELRKRIARILG